MKTIRRVKPVSIGLSKGVRIPVSGKGTGSRGFAVVSKQDAPVVSKFKWRFGRDGYAYTQDSKGSFPSGVGFTVQKAGSSKITRRVYLHRLIALRSGGLKKGKVVDHKNRLRFDDTRTNLRQVTQRTNTFNRDPVAVTKSIKAGFKALGGYKVAQKKRLATIALKGTDVHRAGKKSWATKVKTGDAQSIIHRGLTTKYKTGSIFTAAKKAAQTKIKAGTFSTSIKKGHVTRRQNFTVAQIRNQSIGGAKNAKAFSAKASANRTSFWAGKSKAQRRAIIMKGIRNRKK